MSKRLEGERERSDLAAMGKWRTIDSAPKDGSEILCFAGDQGRHFFGVAQWAERKRQDPRSVSGWFWAFAIRPTHWQPLPDPPTHSADKR